MDRRKYVTGGRARHLRESKVRVVIVARRNMSKRRAMLRTKTERRLPDDTA